MTSRAEVEQERAAQHCRAALAPTYRCQHCETASRGDYWQGFAAGALAAVAIIAAAVVAAVWRLVE